MLDITIKPFIINAIDNFNKDHFDILQDNYLLLNDWKQLHTII